MLKQLDITALRMRRQFLSTSSDETSYDSLFYNMSPVPTMYWCAPGNPPTLPLHVDFDDYLYNSKRRSRRDILKGRFGGGSIAYVTKEDLELFACLYKKDIRGLTNTQFELMKLLEQEGPMNIGLMKEITGMLVKDITPSLHKLQEAFLIFEDQVDNEGDRGWYLFESEFPEVDLDKYTKNEALQLVVPRLAYLCVFFHETMIKSYYKLPLKLIKEVLSDLLTNKILQAVTIEGLNGYMLTQDYDSCQDKTVDNTIDNTVSSILLLQRNDFFVRANADELKVRFTSQWDTLYYLLIDGEFHGAVMGRFKFGPHVIEDIVLDLSDEEKECRKGEIIEAIYEIFDPQCSPIKRYDSYDCIQQ